MEEFDALPESSSSTDVLRALFEGTEDTVYTKMSLNQSVNFDGQIRYLLLIIYMIKTVPFYQRVLRML